MALDDATAISVTSLVFLGGVQLMEQLGPGIADVRTAKRGDSKVRARMNVAEFMAGATVLAAAATISVLAQRPEPLVMAGVVVAGSVLAYEYAWRAPDDTLDPISGQHLAGAR